MTTSVAIQAVVSPPSQNRETGVNRTDADANAGSTTTGKTEKKDFNELMDNTLKKDKKHKDKKSESGNILPQAGNASEKTVKDDRAVAHQKALDAKRKNNKENQSPSIQAVVHGNPYSVTTNGLPVDTGSKNNKTVLHGVKNLSAELNNRKTAGSVTVSQLIGDDFKLVDKLKGHGLPSAGNKIDANSLKLAGLAPLLHKAQALTQHQGKFLDGFSLTDMKAMGDGLMKGMDAGLSNQKLQLDSILTRPDNLTTLTGAEHRTSAISLSSPLNIVTTGSPQNSSALYQSVLQHSFGQSGWDQSMGRQVMWMAGQNIRSAELKLNPANMGSIEVHIDIKDDSVNVGFSSQHLTVRHAIEQSLPRLREMMAEQGLNLTGADVSQHSFSQHQENSFTQQGSKTNQLSSLNRISNTAGSVQPGMMIHEVKIADGAVDYYI